MIMTTSRRIIVHEAKKLLDNDIFLVMVKNAVLLCLLQWYFRVLMLKCNFWTEQQQQWKAKNGLDNDDISWSV